MSNNSPSNAPNGNYHGAENEEIQLQLTLGRGNPSFNTNEPRPPPPLPMQQLHHQNSLHYHSVSTTSPSLQPFFFRSLSPHLAPPPQAVAPPAPLVQQPAVVIEAPSSSSSSAKRQKQSRSTASSSSATKDKDKSETIPPPYPWATDKRCGVHPFAALKSRGQVSITGKVKCRKCERAYEMSFDLEAKFCEVASLLVTHKDEFRHRAPDIWLNPSLPDCVYCRQKNAVRPELEGIKKKNINWLFLFLGQLLGCCTGDHLKYFCKHFGHHRTAAKDRLLYLAYLGMCKQLDPDGPFDL